MGKLIITALAFTFCSLSFADTPACPALGGTYLAKVGWFSFVYYMVVQDRCESLTLLSDLDGKGYNQATFTYKADGQWHQYADGTVARAHFDRGQFVVQKRKEPRGKETVHRYYLNKDGEFTVDLPPEESPDQTTLSLVKWWPGQAPTVKREVRHDHQTNQWLVAGPSGAPIKPLLNYVNEQLSALDQNSVYTCDVTAERSETRNIGFMTFDVKNCEIQVPAAPGI